MKALIAVLVGVVCLLVGLMAGENWSVEAQAKPLLVECYEVYDLQGDDTILLNKCSGASWWYDNGFEGYGGDGQVRPQTWKRIVKE